MKQQVEYLQCVNCTAIIGVEEAVCPNCNEQLAVSKADTADFKGTITAFTTIHIAPEKYRDQAPYTVLLVRLTNKTNVMGRLLPGQTPVQGSTVILDHLSAENGPMFRI